MNRSVTIPTATTVVDNDLTSICGSLEDELGEMGGSKLLVTGGGGFLGYYLIQTALFWNRSFPQHECISVTVYDNFMRGIPNWLSELQGDENLTVTVQDMTEPLPDQMGHFDYVVHAAGIASPKYYRRNPMACIDSNIIGLRSLLDYAVAEQRLGHPVRGMLFYSSSEIYGDPSGDHIPTQEDYRGNVSCTGPRACYDEAKRFGETLCVTYARHEGVPVRIARPFNNYGPGLKITDGRVIPDFARDILAGRDVVMFSDGSPTRTFCYSADAVAGYYKILVRGRSGEPYNIGVEGPEISVGELGDKLVSIARDHFDYSGRIIKQVSAEQDYLVDNPSRRCPNVQKACAELEYAPSVSLDDGLYRNLVWYYYNREAEES